MLEESSERALFVGPGRGELVAAVAAEKARDPLGRLLVLVPNAATAESLRDELARGRALLNVHIQTVEKAAGELAPAVGLVLPSGAERLVVRDLLRSSPAGKPFERLADSPGFLGALASTLRDLVDAGLRGRGLEPPAGASPRLVQLLALARAYEHKRAALALDDDSARFLAAIERVQAGAAPLDCVMLFGLYDATGLQEEFLLALLAHARRARVFLPGHAFAAGFRGRLARALEVEERPLPRAAVASQLDWLRAAWDRDDLGDLARDAGGVPIEDGSVRVFSMPGGEVGAELLARHVTELLAADETLAPGDIECVSRGSGGLAPGSVARELARLGVPLRTSAGTLGETEVGRVLLALGELLDAPRVTRSRVMDLVCDLPWRAEPIALGKQALERRVDAGELALWDKLGRAADLRVVIDADSSSTEAGRLLLRSAKDADKPAARAFLACIDELAGLHKLLRAEGGARPSWSRLGSRLATLLGAWLAEDAEGLGDWTRRLLSLGRLDALPGSADPAGLSWLLEGLAREAFDDGLTPSGGLRLGKLAGRRGSRARWVFLLDGDEGSFPRARSQNILLSDADRQLLAERAPGLAVDLDFVREERALFAELCAMATDGLVLVTTRPGIEGGTATPSRLVSEALGVLSGDALRGAPPSEDLVEGKRPVPLVERFELEAAWRRGAEGMRPVGLREGILFALDDALAAGLPRGRAREAVAQAQRTPSPRDAAELARRAAPGMSAWDGQLSPEVAAQLAETGAFRGTRERGLSPSRLETFAACGMRSLLGAILGVEEHELPEESRGILAAERGTRVHEILERFGRAAKAAGLEPWPAASLDALKACLFEAIDGVIGSARRASPADQSDLWDAEAARYRGLLLGWLQQQQRDAGGWTPHEFEWRFGDVQLELGEGAPLLLRGVADRVDLRRPGGEGGGLEARVVDYKTGKGGDAKDESTRFGQSLQLALYGAAARAHFGAAASKGVYDFVFFGKTATWSGAGKPPSSQSKWCRETDATALEQVRLLVEAMEAGQFWPTPRQDGSSNAYGCGLCAMREACGPWRKDALRTAAEVDPLLAGLRELMQRGEDE